MVKVNELMPKQGNVEIEGVIKEIGNVRVFSKYGRELKVADAIFEDDTGTIKLTLWNEDTQRFKPGDKIKVINGYIGEFQGEKQLTSGKFGSIEKIDDASEEKPVKEDTNNDVDDSALI